MNKTRRKFIDSVAERLEAIKSDIEDILSDEEYAFDSVPESLQESERGQAMCEAIDCLGEAIESVESAIVELYNAKGE